MTKTPFHTLIDAGFLILIPPNENNNLVAIIIKALNEKKIVDRILDLHLAIVFHDNEFTPLLIPDSPIHDPNWDYSPQTMIDEALKRLSHQSPILYKSK